MQQTNERHRFRGAYTLNIYHRSITKSIGHSLIVIRDKELDTPPVYKNDALHSYIYAYIRFHLYYSLHVVAFCVCVAISTWIIFIACCANAIYIIVSIVRSIQKSANYNRAKKKIDAKRRASIIMYGVSVWLIDVTNSCGRAT